MPGGRWVHEATARGGQVNRHRQDLVTPELAWLLAGDVRRPTAG
jgi:hypothetical protein